MEQNHNDHRETEETIVIISFERSLLQAFRNSVVKQKNIIHNYGHGVYCGVAEEVEAIEGCWECKKTVGVLKFDNCVTAKRWAVSDPLIKQPDWLGTSDLHIIPLTRALPCGYPFVVLMSLKILDKETFFGCYKPSHQQLVEEFGGKTRIAGTEEPVKMRGGRSLDFTIIDLFKCRKDFEAWYNSDQYQEICKLRAASSTGHLLVFSLSTVV